MNPSKIQKVRADFLDLVSIKINKLNGILSAEIAHLYLNRHERYLSGQWITSKQDGSRTPALGNRAHKCQWPLGCYYNGQSDLDHILPICAMKNNVNRLYDPNKNSTTLCPIHNRVVKRDSIAIGLWIRNLIIFN